MERNLNENINNAIQGGTGMNIYQKIVEIRKSIKGFSKDSKGYGYEYVSGNQILRAIKEKMDELQVVLIPSVNYNTLNWEKHTYNNTKGQEKLDFIVQAQMTYKWVNAENPADFIEVPWVMIGQQADDISKAVGTAMTYNERYFLLKQFGLPTDEDDADAKTQDSAYGSKATKSQTTNRKLSDAQVKRLIAIGSSKGQQIATLKKVAKSDYNVNDLADLTKKDYDALCARLEKL